MKLWLHPMYSECLMYDLFVPQQIESLKKVEMFNMHVLYAFVCLSKMYNWLCRLTMNNILQLHFILVVVTV